MNTPAPSSALRDIRTHFTTPKVAIALVAIGALLALVGPFGTAEVMAWPARIAYWMTVPALTYGVGYGLYACVAPRLSTALTAPLALTVLALLNSAVITAMIVGMNAVVFNRPASLQDMALFFGITLLVSLLINLLPYGPSSSAVPYSTAPQPPAILDRLPLDKRGPLIALSVEDHYVRIRTTRGEDMVLLRLSDAIREVGDTPGLRVHRSHWVALDRVSAVTRRGDGALLTMVQGADIPVSRANMAAIRDAGLLPK